MYDHDISRRVVAPGQRALRVLALEVRCFRNLREVDFVPGARFNVIHGENGAGKSSLLEALDYLASLRSFRGARRDDLIQQGERATRLTARLAGDRLEHRYEVRLARDRARQVTLDGKRPRSRAAYSSTLQVVLFHPGDLQLVAGSPEQRRAFVDRVLEQFDASYSAALASYHKALKSRNRLLKSERPERRAIQAYDEVLASSGSVIAQTRADLIGGVGPRAEEAFADISAEPAALQVSYEPRVEPEAAAIRRALAKSIDKDLARGFTGEGPHADDVRLTLRKTRARHYGSQGQHRAIVLALKIAELFELERRVQRVPILLLDDVSSELDRSRNRKLFELLARLGGQVFLTTTHPEFILLEHDRRDFEVRGGALQQSR